MGEEYSSIPDTQKHIDQVIGLLETVSEELNERAVNHDASKLKSPELEVFDEFTPKLKNMTYGSIEYKACLAKMKPALDHHYASNRHHPEHFGEPGMHGMNLIDVVEMFCDWYAASQRHGDGDILKSIELNAARFGYCELFKDIFKNTAEWLAEGDKKRG